MGHDGLQQGDRRGDGRKDDQQVEDDAEDRADHAAHAVKHILHGDEEKLRTADLTRGVQRETRGHDAQTRHQSDDGVHDDDDRGILFEVLLLVEVGAVGNHGAHADGQREEHLPTSGGNDLEDAGGFLNDAVGNRQPGTNMYFRPSTAPGSVQARTDADQQHEKQRRHADAAELLDAARDAAHDDDHRGGRRRSSRRSRPRPDW